MFYREMKFTRHSADAGIQNAVKANSIKADWKHFEHSLWIPGQARNDTVSAFSRIGSISLIMNVYEFIRVGSIYHGPGNQKGKISDMEIIWSIMS